MSVGPTTQLGSMFTGASAMAIRYNGVAGFDDTPTVDFFNNAEEQAIAAALIASTPICFPAGTPVQTDKGEVSIEKLNPDEDTIGGKRIVAITQTTPLDKYIVCIKKDALGKGVPCADTRISKEHSVCYNGKMMKAKELVGLCENVLFIPYNKEILYNVLLEEYGMMMVNNMKCETLHPENIMAKIETGKYETSEKRRIYKELTKIFIENDIVGYVRLCMSQKFKK